MGSVHTYLLLVLVSLSALTCDAVQPKKRTTGRRRNKDSFTLGLESCHKNELIEDCRTRQIDQDNCIYRCMSESCWKSFYERAPLEEGEIDNVRYNLFKHCYQKQLTKAQKGASSSTSKSRSKTK